MLTLLILYMEIECLAFRMAAHLKKNCKHYPFVVTSLSVSIKGRCVWLTAQSRGGSIYSYSNRVDREYLETAMSGEDTPPG